MFPSFAFTEQWLRKKAREMAKCDPQILEKSIHALALLGHLQEMGLPLTFRGGTSLLLHLPDIHRLSIDIDIMSPVKGQDLEKVLAGVATKPPFIRMEESVRDGTRLPKRRHFIFFYNSTLNIQGKFPPSVILDVVEEGDEIHTLVSKPITTGFLKAEREVLVRLPTVESLLGDKLTAFAPTTTGVPLRRRDGSNGDVVQVVKQLFDVGILFDHAQDGEDLAKTYQRAQAKEAGYRGGQFTLDVTLEDTIAAALAASPTKPKVQARFPDYPLLRRGFQGMASHLTKKFSEDDFRSAAAKAAALAAYLKLGVPLDFEKLRYTGSPEQLAIIKAGSFNTTAWDWLDGLKQINPAAYHYWQHSASLLEIKPSP